MQQIRTLLFDLGGVIINTDESLAATNLEKLGAVMPTNPEALDHLQRSTVLFINGLIPTNEYIAYLQSLCPSGTDPKEIRRCLCDTLLGIPAARLQRLQALHQRYHIVLLSNISDIIWEHATMQLRQAGSSPEKLFHQYFLSYKMQLAKPDPEIYRQVLTQANLDPNTTLYFDDRAENIAAASALGIHSAHVPENHLETVPEYLAL